jgi:lysozyme
MTDHKIGPDGLAIVKAFESCMRAVKGRPGYFAAYVDPVGVLTIGWGHTNHHSPRFDQSAVWSQAQCDAALAGDMGTFEAHVNRLAKVDLKQHEFDALVSWSFNTGGPSTASLWSALNRGGKASIPANLAQWNKGTVNGQKVVLNGLTRRRKAEGLLFEGKIREAYQVAQITKQPISILPKPPTPPDVPKPKPPAAKPGFWASIFSIFKRKA